MSSIFKILLKYIYQYKYLDLMYLSFEILNYLLKELKKPKDYRKLLVWLGRENWNQNLTTFKPKKTLKIQQFTNIKLT